MNEFLQNISIIIGDRWISIIAIIAVSITVRIIINVARKNAKPQYVKNLRSRGRSHNIVQLEHIEKKIDRLSTKKFYQKINMIAKSFLQQLGQTKLEPATIDQIKQTLISSTKIPPMIINAMFGTMGSYIKKQENEVPKFSADINQKIVTLFHKAYLSDQHPKGESFMNKHQYFQDIKKLIIDITQADEKTSTIPLYKSHL